MKSTNGALRFSFRRLLFSRPRVTLLVGAALLATLFIAAPAVKSVIKSSSWWQSVAHPPCAGYQATLAQDPPTASPPALLATNITTGLQTPTSLASMPNGNLLITEKSGVLTMLDLLSGKTRRVADLTSLVKSSDANGLLTVVLHPRFGVGEEDRIYLFYNRQPDLSIVVASAHLTADAKILPRDLTTLQVIPHQSSRHSGGAMLFLPSGQLLVSIGDDNIGVKAQDATSPLGKILSVSPDVPGQQPIVLASGLRNPAHVAISPHDETLWISDVGNNCIEEVDRIPLSETASTTNFGWPVYEGNLRDPEQVVTTSSALFTMPISTYSHDNGTCAVIGGAFLSDWYIYADYCDGIIHGLPLHAAPGTKAAKLFDLNSLGKRVGVVGIVGDRLGRVWAVEGWSGAIYRLDVAP